MADQVAYAQQICHWFHSYIKNICAHTHTIGMEQGTDSGQQSIITYVDAVKICTIK